MRPIPRTARAREVLLVEAALRVERDRLDGRCRREVQPARKRALYEQARAAQEQADRLKREWERRGDA